MRYSIILAAGKGLRMKSKEEDSKVSFPILGKPIIGYVLDVVDDLKIDKKIIVVGFGGEAIKKIVGDRAEPVWQDVQKGTGHAVLQAYDLLHDLEGETIIVSGDTPLLTKDTLKNLFQKHERYENDVTVLTAYLEKPEGYARIIRDPKSQKILAVKDEKDCSYDEKQFNEVNTGAYIFNNKLLFDILKRENPDGNQSLQLSTVVSLIIKEGGKVDSYVTLDQEEAFSIANRQQLAYVSKILSKKINKKLMMSGVSIEDPNTTHISPDVTIGQDTIILPNTNILGKCEIGEENYIGPNAYVSNANIGNKNVIKGSWIEDSKIGNNNVIEPQVVIKDGSEIGNNQTIEPFQLVKNKVIR